jgi:hypothetical protein
LEDEAGNLSWQTAVVNGTEWRFTPQLTVPGSYTLVVEAYDLAGNVSAMGIYALAVGGSATYELYLPAIYKAEN